MWNCIILADAVGFKIINIRLTGNKDWKNQIILKSLEGNKPKDLQRV
jgi:hypothetical protein